MLKFIHILTVLALMAGLNACSPIAVPQTATPAANRPAAAAPTIKPAVSVTPFPTPTAAASITPLASLTAQPSVTAMPKPPSSAAVKGTGTPIGPQQDIGDGSNGCLNASLVKDVTIPDGTQINAGQTFEKTWRFFNSGTCSWLASTTIKFVKGDDMQAAPNNTGSETTVNNKADVSVTLVAPISAGHYKAYFRLADKNGNLFGPMVFVSIVVVATPAAN